MKSNTMTMEAPSTEHSNPFFRFEVSRVCATCTKQLETGTYYSLDTLVDLTDNVNLIHVLVSLCQFKCEENGPSNICRECFYKTSLFYEFHQQCKNSVMLFDKYVEWQKQFLKPDIVDLGIYDTDAISTNVEEEQDEKLTIDIEETVISEAMSTHVEEEQDVKLTIDIEETVISEAISTNVEEEQDVKLTIGNEETVISEAMSTHVEEEHDVKLTIDIEETVISEGTLVNANDDFNSLRQVVGVESDMSCNSNEATKSNMLKEKSKQNKLYECTKCDATYNNSKCLVYHTNLHTNKHAHSYCGKANGSSVQLKLHERLYTGQLPYPCLVYICKICDKRFLSNSLLTQHQLIHIQKRPFKCKVCEATFKARSVLEQHMERHIQNKQHKCTVCNKMFIQSSDLKRHLQKHERVVDKDENEECVSLDSKSSSQDEETNQQTRESNMLEEKSKQDKLYKCRECDATYNNPDSFYYHTNLHTNKYACSYCGKRNGTSFRLKLHERLHTGELPYSCGKCDKRFMSKAILMRHQRTHILQTPFRCEVCKEIFRNRSMLAQHTCRHERVAGNDENEESVSKDSKSSSQGDDKMYKCTECDAKYDIYDSFYRHQNIHKKRFVCSHCDYPCSSQPALRMHERIHTGERPFVCGKCGKQFSKKGNLKTHLVTHTRKRIFKCEICEKAFKSRTVLHRHIQKHGE